MYEIRIGTVIIDYSEAILKTMPHIAKEPLPQYEPIPFGSVTADYVEVPVNDVNLAREDTIRINCPSDLPS